MTNARIPISSHSRSDTQCLFPSLLRALTVLLGVSACSKSIEIKFTNPSELNVGVNVTIKDRSQKQVGTDAFDIPAVMKPSPKPASGTGPDDATQPQTAPNVVTQSLIAPVGGSIEVRYSPVGGNAEFAAPTFPVSNRRRGTDKVTITLQEFKAYNPNAPEETLRTLAKSLNWDTNTKILRLEDIEKYLGAAIILGSGDTLEQRQGFIKLSDIKYTNERSSAPFESKTVTSKEAVLNVQVNIPVYGKISSSMKAGSLYSVAWKLQHNLYTSTFSPQDTLASLTDAERLGIRRQLATVPDDAVLWFVSGMDVLETGTFSTIDGRSIKTSAELAAASVFIADGSYAFYDEKSEHVDMSGKAYNVKLTKWTTAGVLERAIKANGELQPGVKLEPLRDSIDGTSILSSFVQP